MARKIVFIHSLPVKSIRKPSPYFGGVDIVIVGPMLFTRIIRWVNADAFNSASIVREECFKRKEVISFNEQVSTTRLTYG
jgi:hypothetical protein